MIDKDQIEKFNEMITHLANIGEPLEKIFVQTNRDIIDLLKEPEFIAGEDITAVMHLISIAARFEMLHLGLVSIRESLKAIWETHPELHEGYTAIDPDLTTGPTDEEVKASNDFHDLQDIFGPSLKGSALPLEKAILNTITDEDDEDPVQPTKITSN